MKFYFALVNGVPRLDITGLSPDEVYIRGAKVMGPQDWAYYRRENLVEVKQAKLEIMV